MQLFSSPAQGRLTARIVPSAHVDYEQKKPANRVFQDIDTLLTQLEPLPARVDDSETTLFAFDTKEVSVLIHVAVTKDREAIHIHSCRDANEPAEKALKRLTANLMTEFTPRATLPDNRKGKKTQDKAKMAQTPSKLPSIHDGSGEVQLRKRSNLDLWRELSHANAIISFPIGPGQSVDLHVDACPPTVLAIQAFEQLEQRVFSGVPLIVTTRVLHTNRARVSWFSNGKVVEEDSHSYVPTNVGHKIQIVVRPEGGTHFESYEFLHAVEAIPHLPLVQDLRREWTIPRTDGKQLLRVLTYNLLADQYAKGERPQHDYCPPEILHRSHRMPLLMYEILSYHADILCLQEVDWYIFQSYYQPLLESQGYQGYFASKLSGQQEGCAMFWSTEKFARVDENDISSIGINEILLDDTDDGWNAPQQLFQQLPHMKGRIQELGQVLQWTTLVSRENDSLRVVVGNTHLYYHPLGDHFRVVQAYGACRKLNQLGCSRIVLCGDFNSDPASGAIQLLLDRSIDSSHPTAWENIETHPPRKTTVEDTGIDIPTMALSPAFPVLKASCIAPFTHCIPGFVSTLDYIVSSLPCKEAAPMPPLNGSQQHMPNASMPSDHVSLVAEYEWGG
jgi:mRNA deadenylase 3'-5' endonuclease subunit Ccr4